MSKIKGALKTLYSRYTLADQVNADAAMLMMLRQSSMRHSPLRMRKYNTICQKYGCFIPPSCRLGGGIAFPHGLYGIFISQRAVLGRNCVVFHQVTIGSNSLKDSKGAGAPTIGDNVYIGAGAKVIGNCHVGDNVRIGANAVVTEDVPANSTVVGVKSRVILHQAKRDNVFVAVK